MRSVLLGRSDFRIEDTIRRVSGVVSGIFSMVPYTVLYMGIPLINCDSVLVWDTLAILLEGGKVMVVPVGVITDTLWGVRLIMFIW
jgi:hypothetical protein